MNNYSEDQRGPSVRAGPGHPAGGHPGKHNAITDVPGVGVGYVTLDPVDGSACTGVTAILPRGAGSVGVAPRAPIR